MLTIFGASAVVIAPLIAAAWLPPEFPYWLRQLLLCLWGVGAVLAAERLLVATTLRECAHAIGFVAAPPGIAIVAVIVSIPMWAFLPLLAWHSGARVGLRPDWPMLMAGVLLINGITEEAIHRGFVFRNFRRGRSFAIAATLSATVFAGQHFYILLTAGWQIGWGAVTLALLISYPLAFAFERGGNSIVAAAILHTSANAPVIVLNLPDDVMANGLLPHMAVVLISLYLVFGFAGRRA